MNLIKHQWSDADIIYLNVKDPFESKYELLFNGWEQVGIKQKKKIIVLIVFDDMILDTEVNKKLKTLVAELFMREKATFPLFLYHSVLLRCLKL